MLRSVASLSSYELSEAKERTPMVEKLVRMPFLIKEFCRYDTGRTTLANLANILQLSITIMKEIVVLSLFSVSLIFHVFWFILMREDDWMNEKFREKVVLKKWKMT